MKHTAFSYTNAKGETKQRSVIVTQEPNKYVCGYDVADLSEASTLELAKKLGKAVDELKLAFETLSAEYGVSYKQFKPELIRDEVSEYI